MTKNKFNNFKVDDPGHVYTLPQYSRDGYDDIGTRELIFVKRSSAAIKYKHDMLGTNSQSVIRALIDRTQYLYNVLPCVETVEALRALCEAYYWYEVRAWRRKQQKINRTKKYHKSNKWPPFTITDVIYLPLGKDGHVICKEK